MTATLVDSNVILDVLTEDPQWLAWSAQAIAAAAEKSTLCINPVIYSEISIRFESIEELEEALSPHWFRRLHLPWEAAFLAGKCFIHYQRRGGKRRSPLPDFFIGAHAAVAEMRLLTRDVARYRTYFPRVRLITPPVA